MALHSMGTNSNTSLTSLAAWSAVLTAADEAAIAQSIVGDGGFASALSGYSAGETYILATSATHSNTTLDTLVARAGSPPLTQIHVGDLILGVGIPAGTWVQAFNGTTTVTMSQAATTSSTPGVAFIRPSPFRPLFNPGQAILEIPKRGTLRVLPGDYVVIDNTGWPILLSGATVGYAASLWHFV